jgi:hypothetical protein
MYELAQEMESNIITGRPVSMDPQEDRRISALRQHLPRSPLWNNIPKWNRTIEEINELAKSMKDRIETELKQDEQVLGIDSQIRDRFISGLIAALNSQVDQWVTGSPGLDLDIHIYIEPDSESGHVICYGKNRISPLSKEQAERYEPAVRDIIRRVESDGKETDEFGKIEKLNIQIDNLKRRIRDELAVIIMRRVVPGRCRYCPL